MAKKQLKKLNQPKKYLQGGSNMGSVSMMRQNPYFIGQVNQDAAEENLANMQEQVMQNKQTAAQAKKDARDMQNQQLDQTIRNNTSNIIKGVATDQKAGRLGSLFTRGPLSGQAAMNISAGTQIAPMYAAPATTTVASNVGSLAPGAVEVGANLANTSTNVVSGVNAATAGVPAAVAPTGEFVTQGIASGAKGAAGLSSLATAGIGAAAMIGGKVIQKRADDNSAYTATDKEMRGNLGGGALAGAGTGFSTGAMIGSIVPGIGNVVGGAIGAGIGAGIGALKARKENKAAEEEAQRLQREQAAMRGAFQGAFVNSRLTSADTGFGLNSSNMNNQFTNQYQVAQTGGVTGIQEDRRTKKVPGGKIVPIEGTDAVEFVGRTHAQGGILIDKNTEVEGGGKNGQGETMDQVVMNDNNKQDYIFSKYLKLGGKSFAQRHKEILKGSGSQAEIQQLAAMQEKVAGRDSKQVAQYGGVHKYLDGGVKPCPECPPGTICDVATGACVPDEDSGSGNSYDWNATGLDGFKAKQQSAAPSKPAGKQISQADYDFYIREKNAKLADQQRQIAAQNGTANTPADNKVPANTAKTPNGYTPVKLPFTALESEKFDPKGKMQAWARGEGKAMMDKSMAESEAYDAERKKAMDSNNRWGAAEDNVVPYNYDPSTGYHTDVESNGTARWDTPRRILYKDGKPEETEPGSGVYKTAFRENPEDIAALQKEGYYKKKDSEGTTYDWGDSGFDEKTGKWIDFKDNPAFAVEQGYDVPGYSAPAGVKPPANTQPAAQTSLADDIDKMWSDKGYVKNADGDWVLPEESQQPATTGTATYTAPTGVTPPAATNPPAATTNTGGSNAPLTDAEMFAPAAKRATSTGAAAGTPQTPEEKEAARLAGLPRLFMGANRTIDPTTGEATVYTDKPLMGVGAMAGSRLGTATGSQEDLAKVTNNSYDQAWQNKADNLYTNQKDASGGGLSSSDAIKDRDKIAESNWGQKYGYKKGMSADEAKAAHDKFAADVNSLFANNPDEMLGYFQYIIDGGDPTKTDSYLGKDAEQIRNNLKTKGFIGADGRPIPGKEKEMADYLQKQATNNAVGPIHNALGSYTAERSATKIKLKEGEKKKDEVVTQELPKKYEPCPPGTYRSGDGSCKPVGDVPQASRISGALMAGLGQLIPVGAALANPYKIAPGIMGTAAAKGALLQRVNMNQERAANIQQNVAYKNAVINQNAGPGALAAMQMANTKTNEQMLKIAQQEQAQNRQLAGDEAKLGMQASMFNVESDQKRQMFNKEFNQGERRYRREDILGALDTAAARVAGIFKDDRSYKAQERLATALDETGSYDRFSILEQLNKDAQRKGSPYYGTTEAERRRIAAAMHKQLNPDGYVAMTEYNKLQEEKAKLQKEREEAEKKNQAKFGGARQYVSRLGELKGVRATKAKI